MPYADEERELDFTLRVLELTEVAEGSITR